MDSSLHSLFSTDAHAETASQAGDNEVEAAGDEVSSDEGSPFNPESNVFATLPRKESPTVTETDELETQADKLQKGLRAETPSDPRRQSEPIGDFRRQVEPARVVRRRSEAASELTRDMRLSAHSESVALSSSQTDNSQEPEPVDPSSLALRVQDRCGKPMECSVGFVCPFHAQISLALFLQLQNASRLLTRYRNVFVRCTARFVDDASTIAAVPIDVPLRGDCDVVRGDGERAARQRPQGVHVQLLHWRPCSHD